MYVGKKLKQLRISKDLNQADMAVKLGVSQPYYSSVESGKKPITQKMMSKLKSIFSIDMSFFTDKVDLENGYNNGGISTDIPPTSSREYYKRSYEKFEINRDQTWQNLYKIADERLDKIEFYYQRIVDLKLLLQEKLHIQIIKESEVDTFNFFEKSIINKFGGDAVNGSVRAKHSTSDELRVFNNDLFDLLNLLELRFFELFAILYRGLRKGKLGKGNDLVPEFID